jgi:hypothetical protein
MALYVTRERDLALYKCLHNADKIMHVKELALVYMEAE